MAISKWTMTASAAIVASLLVTGCGQSKQPVQGNQGASVPAPAVQESPKGQTSQPSAQPAPSQDQQIKLKLYYGDDQMEKLVEQQGTITVKQDSEKYNAALKALTATTDSKQIALLKGFQFKSAVLKDGQLNVDLSMSPEARLGSGGEKLALDAIQNTLFQFVEVKAIDLLLDGKPVESLMGHMELPHPITRK
jgi:hypothetical protein